MSDVLSCKTCNRPVQITCPVHGVDFVPDRRVNLVHDAPKTARPAPTVKRVVRRHEVRLRERIIAQMQNAADVPWSATDIARCFDITPKHASVEISDLHKAGRIVRVSRGLYVLPGHS